MTSEKTTQAKPVKPTEADQPRSLTDAVRIERAASDVDTAAVTIEHTFSLWNLGEDTRKEMLDRFAQLVDRAEAAAEEMAHAARSMHGAAERIAATEAARRGH